MTESPETIELLWTYCTIERRVIPRNWQKVYEMLASKRQLPTGGWEPPLPLILAAWHITTPLEKQLRFRGHVQWAADHGQLEQVGAHLRALREDEWFHYGEL